MKKQKLDEGVFNKIHEMVGSASACWTNMSGAGEFKSQQAGEVANELCEYVHRHMIPKPKSMWAKIKHQLKCMFYGTIPGVIVYLFFGLLLWLAMNTYIKMTYFECVGIFITLRVVKHGIIDLKPITYDKED